MGRQHHLFHTGCRLSWQAGYGDGEPFDTQYRGFNNTQADNFSAVMTLWDSYIAPSITEVSDSNPGQIRIAFTDVTARAEAGAAGYAYLPPAGTQPLPIHGDIWIDESLKSASFAPESQDFEILLHEAGHALGLKHPFEAPTLPAGYDSKTYTVMSYTAEDNFFNWSSGVDGISYSVSGTVDFTPMVLDILAIQKHYGADKSTAKGDTTYAFTDTSLDGRQAIYDAGGRDTIDLSALSRGSTVDLRPGAYSDIAHYNVNDQIDDLAAIYGAAFKSFIRDSMTSAGNPAYEWERNVGLSFSTTIENAIGSNSADTVIGNDSKNSIRGLGGQDRLDGGKGNDTLVGNGGSDIFVFATGRDRDRITDFNASGADHDTIDLSGLKSVADFNDLQAHHIEKVDANIVIDGGQGDVLTLVGVKIKTLDASDFDF